MNGENRYRISSEYLDYRESRVKFWDLTWDNWKNRKGWGGYYHKRLSKIYGFIIPPQASVLEVGCGNGKLLGNLPNSDKTGIDFSSGAIALAKSQYPDCEFVCSDINEYAPLRTFDYIILSDVLGDLWDVEIALKQLRTLCHRKTRIVVNYYSKLWELPLRFGEFLRIKKPNKQQNWLSRDDVRNLLYLTDFEVIKTWQEVLLPLWLPIFTAFFNQFLVRIWFFRQFALSNFTICRLNPDPDLSSQKPSVSVVVAARNEAGHIKELISRLPSMGLWTELIFVEGGSTDNTFQAISTEIANNKDRRIRLYKQEGKGKGDAVRKGFEESNGDILMVLDADLTVPPERLPQFYNALVNGKGDFINGVRLVYPMDQKAMQPFNLMGNKFFSIAFSWLLGQPIKDTLCGTKVLWKSDYKYISMNRDYFGNFDPFGDFDLIFGAVKLGLKIQDLPIRYRERTYGNTNIQRWKHGWLLLRMTLFASRKIKFI